jgi:hypothetical protein
MRVKDFQLDCKMDLGLNPSREAKWLSDSRRRSLAIAYNGRCAYNPAHILPATRFHVDHVVDGPHTACHHSCVNYIWNTVPVCHSCNGMKGHTNGNFITFLSHCALDIAQENGLDIYATIDAHIRNFTTKLYTPIRGYESDYTFMPAADLLRGAYTLTRLDNGTVVINGGK